MLIRSSRNLPSKAILVIKPAPEEICSLRGLWKSIQCEDWVCRIYPK